MPYCKYPGMTIIEALTVIAMMSALFIVIGDLSVRATKVYLQTKGRIASQSGEMLAMKRMALELRSAMSIHTAVCTDTCLEFTAPKINTSTGFVSVIYNTATKSLQLEQGQTVRYFLGVKEFPAPGNPNQWNAVPWTTGNMIFRVDDAIPCVGGKYTQAPVLIEGITANPAIPDPMHAGQIITTAIFAYHRVDVNNTQLPLNLVDITLTIPTNIGGNTIVNHTLQQQIQLRNLH